MKIFTNILGAVLSWFITVLVMYGIWKMLGPDFRLWVASIIWLALLLFGAFQGNKNQNSNSQ